MQQAEEEEEEDQPNFCKPTNNRQGIQSNFLQRNKCKDLNGGQMHPDIVHVTTTEHDRRSRRC
jgi:hypothetical protein